MGKVTESLGCVADSATAIALANGGYIDLANPDPTLIRASDIAQGLGNLCRFNGQIYRFYSVAEHSYLCTLWAAKLGFSEDCCRAILLHDAAEAYCGDVTSPLKIILGDAYRFAEQRISSAIAERFGVDFEAHQEQIRQVDLGMLYVEKSYLYPNDTHTWRAFGKSFVLPDHADAIGISCWSPIAATARYMLAFQNYFGPKGFGD